MYSQQSNYSQEQEVEQEVLDPLFNYLLPNQVLDIRLLVDQAQQYLTWHEGVCQQRRLQRRKRFPKLQPPLPKYLTRQRQRLSLMQQQQIIKMRFGNIGRTTLPVKPIKIKEIALQVGCKFQTASNVIRRYRLNYFVMQYSGVKKRTKFKNLVLNESEQLFLCQQQVLQDWAHLSLAKRCDLIYQEYGKKLSRKTLAKYYRNHGITYKKVGYVHPCTLSDEQLATRRTEFIANLIRYFSEHMKVIYFDETSTNKWDWKTHVWQDRNEPLLFYQNPQRGKSLTVLGAISTHDDGLYYCIAESTNTESVYSFFQYLSTEINLNNAVLVLDNHRAHHSLKVIQLLRDLGVTVLFLPPSTSYFNAIEFVWRYFKNRTRNSMIEPHQQMITDQQFFEKVVLALNSINKYEVKAIIEEAYPMMLKHLRNH